MPTFNSIYEKWEIGEVYSFSPIVESSPLPTEFRRVRLEGIGGYNNARILAGSDIYSQWRNIYPDLPAGTPDSPEKCRWLNFTGTGGVTIVLAEPWIDGSTVTPTDFLNRVIYLTETSAQQMAKIQNYLNQIKAKFTIDG